MNMFRTSPEWRTVPIYSIADIYLKNEDQSRARNITSKHRIFMSARRPNMAKPTASIASQTSSYLRPRQLVYPPARAG